jgi:hypothetical protein
MKITCHYLGELSYDPQAKRKFIVTEDGRLFFGICLQHKDLALYIQLPPTTVIIGAGIVPEPHLLTSTDDVLWGGWRSFGYEIITPEDLRPHIMEALLYYTKEGQD